MRRAAKVDTNQAAIVAGLRQLGFSVLLLYRVGSGCPDILAGKARRNVLFEIKTDKGVLTPDEIAFFEDWRGDVRVARSLEDILTVFED